MSKLKQLLQKTKNYVFNDLREIIAPTSLPDPPGYVAPPKVSKRDWLKMVGQVLKMYKDTWDSKKLNAMHRQKHGEDLFDMEVKATKQELKSLAEELGDASRGGAVALKPLLYKLWNTRAVAYRDAVQQFILGYKEGFQESNNPYIPEDVKQEMRQTHGVEGQHQNPAAPEGPSEARGDQHSTSDHKQNTSP